MAGMVTEIVTDPMAVHGEVVTMPAGMMRVMMAAVVDAVVKMRGAWPKKNPWLKNPRLKNPGPKDPWPDMP